MTRWIVAGVLVVVLIGLIVMDEVGFQAASPEVQQTPDVVGGDTIPPEAIKKEVAEREAREALRKVAEAPCQQVVATLEATVGAEKRDEVGRSLYDVKMLTPEQVAALCVSLEGQPPEVVVAKMYEASGVTP